MVQADLLVSDGDRQIAWVAGGSIEVKRASRAD